ncbi:MAG: type II toxin-antitoxin system RelE/ParE family toxin [Roseovarius sp.]|nr:type II toxin-antitoxin system RelE/ParE family toxin [Roseovarius sp.]MCY4315416.1 type II toxin-antitoxin system RelE/ParE family toxin [Roseovarius sp.]
MKLVWSPQAEEDLYNIVEYIAGDNPVAAFDMFERITLTVAKILPGNPRAGRPGRGLMEQGNWLSMRATSPPAAFQKTGLMSLQFNMRHG